MGEIVRRPELADGAVFIGAARPQGPRGGVYRGGR